jgi:Sulfatase
MQEQESVQRFGPPTREIRAFLELFALAGIAITQPTLDILSKNTGVFLTRGTSVATVVEITLLVTVVPAAALWTAEVLVGLMLAATRRFVHGILLAVLIAIFGLEFVKKASSLGPTALILIAIAIGLLGGALFLLSVTARTWLHYLAIAPVFFAVLFIFFSPVSDAVFRSSPATAANVKVAQPHRVVMVVMDEFPLESLLDGTGQIDKALYPNFAALAGDSTWYRNETTVAPYTVYAVPSIMTGEYPHGPNALPIAAEYPHNLFDLLGGTYRLNVREVVTALCPNQVCRERVLGSNGSSGLDGVLHDTIHLWTEFAAPHRHPFSFNEVGAALVALPTAQDFVKSLKPATKPQLDFVHIELPHQPWQLNAELQSNENAAPAQGSTKLIWSPAWSAVVARERHLLQVQAVDTLLGQIVAKLKAVNGWDDTLFVLTADHGVAFTDGEPLRSVTKANYDQIMWTPLFIKAPHQTAGVIDDRAAESVDIMPTIADMLGVKSPWPAAGSSLLGPAEPDPQRRMYQWATTPFAFQPPNADAPAPGHDYLTYDGVEGFAKVLKARAAPAVGEPDLRIYRIGPYPDLVGKQVAPMIDTGGTAPTRATVSTLSLFKHVRPGAPKDPWTYVEGYLNGAPKPVPIALAVNGVVAGLTIANPFQGTTNGFYFAVLSPKMFHAGANDLTMYAISGPAAAPRLVPIHIRTD